MFGYGKLFGIAVPIIVTAVFVGIVYIYINWTRMGRYLYAIGGNPKASELSGINTKFHLFMTYVIASAITGISALLLTARLESGESNIGVEYPLMSIAACAIVKKMRSFMRDNSVTGKIVIRGKDLDFLVDEEGFGLDRNEFIALDGSTFRTILSEHRNHADRPTDLPTHIYI